MFTVNIGPITCTGLKIKEATVAVPGTKATVHPEYTGCKVAGIPGTVLTAGCNYTFTGVVGALGTAKVDVVCEAGKKITITNIGNNCVVTVGEQEIAEHVLFTNKIDAEGFDDLTLDVNINPTKANGGIKYTETGTACVKNGVTSENGKYVGNATIQAWEDNKEGKQGNRAHILVS